MPYYFTISWEFMDITISIQYDMQYNTYGKQCLIRVMIWQLGFPAISLTVKSVEHECEVITITFLGMGHDLSGTGIF